MTHAQLSDDELRTLLKSIDPVQDQAPLPNLSLPASAVAGQSRQPRYGRRRWLPIAVAAAVAMVVLGGILVRSFPPQVTLTESAAQQCPYRPLSEVLSSTDLAVSGTVEAVKPATIVIDVDHWYRGGGSADRIVIRREPGASLSPRVGMKWRAGDRYLVAASQGLVDECSGGTGRWSPALAAAYHKAFG
jgi:hypothetical protein